MDDKDVVIQELRAEIRSMRDSWEADQQERVRITELLEQAKRYPWYAELKALVTDMMQVSGFYDTQEIYPDCTVQVWRNSRTGAVSVGWWQNGGDG